MVIIRYLILGFSLLCVFDSFSQVTEEWVARYHPSINSNEFAVDMVMDEQSNVYVAGKIKPLNNENYNWLILKYKINGNLEWDYTYNGPFGNGADEAVSIAFSNPQNCLYVTGFVTDANSGNKNIVTKKLSLDGILLWTQSYISNNDSPYKIAISPTGDIYCAGISGISGLLIRYDQNGDSLWTKKYNFQNNNNSGLIDIAIDQSENIYTVSRSGDDIVTAIFNSNGDVLWEKAYNGPGNDFDEPSGLEIDNSGNVYVAGKSKGNGTDYDCLVLSYNNTGFLRWDARISSPGSNEDAAKDIAIDNSNNIYVTGYIDASSGGTNFLTAKYNYLGNLLWQMQFNSVNNLWDAAQSIFIGYDNSIYVTGNSGVPPSPFLGDYQTLKYDQEGNLLWLIQYNGMPSENGEDISQKILVDNNNNVFVTGSSRGPLFFDAATIKYTQVIGIDPISMEIPEKYLLEQNFPNPFNPATKIRFSIPAPSEGGTQDVKIIIYDVLGKVIETPLNIQLKAGSYEITWDASEYTSGVYFYKLVTDNFTEARKMLMIK